MQKEERKPKWTHILSALSSARGNSLRFYQLPDPSRHPGHQQSGPGHLPLSPSSAPQSRPPLCPRGCRSLLGGPPASTWLPSGLVSTQQPKQPSQTSVK